MRKVTFIQKNWDGQGNDRSFVFWPRADQVELFVQRKSRAFNMEHTEVVIG